MGIVASPNGVVVIGYFYLFSIFFPLWKWVSRPSLSGVMPICSMLEMVEHLGAMMEAQGSEAEDGQNGSQLRPLSSSLTLYHLYLKSRLHLAE